MQIGGDAGLEVRVPVAAGSHVVGVSFVRELWEPEGLPQPLQRGRVIANDQVYMDYANVGVGPDRRTVRRVSAARRRAVRPPRSIRLRRAEAPPASAPAPGRILSATARLAYRRPVTNADVQTLLEFYRQRTKGRRRFPRQAFNSRSNACWWIRNFCCACIEIPDSRRGAFGNPQSLVRSRQSRRHRLSDLEVASRLSFFLWSSIPDDRLLTLAERGQLTNPPVLEQEVRRMLADPRAIDGAGRQLRRAVAEPPARRGSRGRSGALSELRPEPAPGLSARDGAVRRQHDSRRPQRRGAAERRPTRS